MRRRDLLRSLVGLAVVPALPDLGHTVECTGRYWLGVDWGLREGSVSRMVVVSTPPGEPGVFYDLCKAAARAPSWHNRFAPAGSFSQAGLAVWRRLTGDMLPESEAPWQRTRPAG